MKKRVISAVILILLALPLIMEGGTVFAIAIGMIGIFALKEVMDLKRSHSNISSGMSLVIYLSFLFLLYYTPFEYSKVNGINYSVMGVILLLYLMPVMFYAKDNTYKTSDAFYFLGVTFFLFLACHTVILARVHSLWLFLYLVLVPVLTDTFAYLFGMLVGKRKVAPNISPNKTVEGCVLGSVSATVLASIFYLNFVFSMEIWLLLLLTLGLSIAGQFGDLFFSKMKRENEIKDFANLIPGHGGILDRFDSMLNVAIVFLLFMSYFTF
ncbi:MAG: phosphatidate cytidylyltransferase [Bacilli bacterium]|nr:phosphatidate cytidylyltransferase [Bacilli bacterium]